MRNACFVLWILLASPAPAEGPGFETTRLGGFRLEMEVEVSGDPATAFRAFTAETLEWWDHHHSENPHRMYFELRPGGGFVEEFDAEGNGALHATVILVERGKRLRFSGPLGFSGYPLDMVHDLEFTPSGKGTSVVLRLRGAGELEEGWPAAVRSVWHHFLVERFKPYMERRASP